jgi:formylglycine-generating enzyme required for sulfatase activity
MITVQGGTLPQSSGLAGQTVSTFQIGKYEVTWGEWQEVRTWALANGYSDLANVGEAPTGSHPVAAVSWYDVIKWCNARSEKEGLSPVYFVDGSIYKTGEFSPTISNVSNGYRLPSEAEWEWAARGGIMSQGYSYSGSNSPDIVAVYNTNEDTARSVGTLNPNELGIFDMSGNVWEWCFDQYTIFQFRVSQACGGSYQSGFERCAVTERYKPLLPNYKSDIDIGFRVVRGL